MTLITMSKKELTRFEVIKRLARKEINGTKAAGLLHQRYHDFGPTFASEKLAEDHHFKHDPKTIRRIMMSEDLWQPQKKTNGSIHRQWRERKTAHGERVQFYGSYKHW